MVKPYIVLDNQSIPGRVQACILHQPKLDAQPEVVDTAIVSEGNNHKVRLMAILKVMWVCRGYNPMAFEREWEAAHMGLA